MQGLNWYTYCNNNPMRYVDPSGKAWTEAMWWLCAVDGPVPVGDAVYVVGIIVEGAIIGSIILAQGDSRLTDNTPAKTQAETAPAPPPTPKPGKELAKAGKDIAKTEITRRLLEETKKLLDTPEGNGGNEGKKPERITNPKHHPNSNSPEPKNVAELYNNSIVDKNGVRWAKDADGNIHRFSAPSNGQTHWNGSTNGTKPIKLSDIPIEIRRALE